MILDLQFHLKKLTKFRSKAQKISFAACSKSFFCDDMCGITLIIILWYLTEDTVDLAHLRLAYLEFSRMPD